MNISDRRIQLERPEVAEQRTSIELARHCCFARGALIRKVVHNVSLRAATSEDAAFALRVTEACMRVYAEQAWGNWDGRADFHLAFDEVIQLAGRDIGLIALIAARMVGFLTSSICCRLTKTGALAAIYCNAGRGTASFH